MLRLLFLALLAATLIGYATGGRFGNLAETRFRWAWVGLVAIVLQFLPLEGDIGSAALMISLLLLAAVATVNWRLPGFILILLGVYMNFLVISVNGGMPITREAIEASGQTDTIAELRQLDSPKHHLRTPQDELVFLADSIGIPAPIRQAVSIGDLTAIVGMMWFVVAAMRRTPTTAPALAGVAVAGVPPPEGAPAAVADSVEAGSEVEVRRRPSIAGAFGRDSRLGRLLRHRDFRLLFVAQTLTMFGDVALVLVLGIWMKDLTGSNAAAGSVFLVYTLPAAITPLAGPLIDRFPRRRIMIWNDLLTMVVVLLLLLVTDRGDIWVIYAVAFFYGAVQIVFFAARSGLLVSMLPQEQLPEANGLLESLRHGLRIVGPLAGAGLFALWGGGAVALLDASVFAVSALLLSFIRAPDLRRSEQEGSIRSELVAGIRHIVRTVDIRRVVFYTAAVLMVLGIIEVAVFALIEEGLGKPPEFLGVLSTVEGLGAIVGGLTAATVLARLGEVRLAAAALIGFGLAIGLNSTAQLSIVLPAGLCAGVGVAFYFVSYQTLLQRRTPLELQGRVFTASEAITTVPYSLSIAIGAAIVGIVDFRYLYIAVALACAIGGGLLYRLGGEQAPPATETIGAATVQPLPAGPAESMGGAAPTEPLPVDPETPS